ncbi:GNAT family N-acetyltransferase [Jannaschia formosa]|uniref:GNAT family N-acetyltransferase n=1 Tax=Jannaschia formosa TaxID=2259592 RepID=UPI000E1BBB28|nr:GNAT family N-acetyltransferase [Jannaschia formosa]TFL16556.1 N-acetyltransferase [Jannaschia formosa]
MLGHWALRGFGLFAVRNRKTGTFVGSVGLIEPEGWPEPEATWTIATEHQGKGYAREAASAVLAHTFDTVRSSRVVSYIPPDNAASRRVASAIGMARSGEVAVFGDTAERWVTVRGDGCPLQENNPAP